MLGNCLSRRNIPKINALRKMALTEGVMWQALLITDIFYIYLFVTR